MSKIVEMSGRVAFVAISICMATAFGAGQKEQPPYETTVIGKAKQPGSRLILAIPPVKYAKVK